jgi:hypothetical protein
MIAGRRWGSFYWLGILTMMAVILWPPASVLRSADDAKDKKKSSAKKSDKDKPPEVIVDFGPDDEDGKTPAKKPAASKKGKTPAKAPAKTPAKTPVKSPKKKPAADETDDEAGDEKPAGGKTKPKKEKAEEIPEFEGAPDDVCKVCLGTGFVPLSGRRPFVHTEGERAPSPATCVPWRFCPRCMRDHEPDELVEAEKDRLQSAGKSNLFWEGRTGLKLIRVESRHLAHHCDLPTDMARRQGQAAETIAAYLKKQTKSIFLTQMRPGKYEQLFVWDRPKYLKMIDICKSIDEFQGARDWHLSAQCGGFAGRITAIDNAEEGDPLPPEHTTVSRFGMRSVNEATGFKSTDWLDCGMAYCCEYSVMNKVRIHYIDYQVNDVRLGDDWMVEARRHAQMKKLRPWREMVKIPLEAWSPAEHLSAFAYVAHLFRTDPRKFCLMCLAIREGQSEVQAIESVYGKSLEDLQKGCYKWLGVK